jgi:hypothetical protein
MILHREGGRGRMAKAASFPAQQGESMSEEIRLSLTDRLSVSLTDVDLLASLSNTEDNFIERKTIKDADGWLKTAVAFANSCPIDYPGVLYVGVDNKGFVQQHGATPPDFEELQKKVSGVIRSAWPPIYHLPKTLRKNGLEFIAVVVPGSSLRPHFSGPSWVRVGPENREASEEQYDELLAQRSSKFRELHKLIGKIIHWKAFSPFTGGADGTVVACNQFFITVHSQNYKRCFPIDWITINFDPGNERYDLIIQG